MKGEVGSGGGGGALFCTTCFYNGAGRGKMRKGEVALFVNLARMIGGGGGICGRGRGNCLLNLLR